MACSRLLVCAFFVILSVFCLQTEAAYSRIPVLYDTGAYSADDIGYCDSKCPSLKCCVCARIPHICAVCCDENADSATVNKHD
ncbi:hypothetical protein DCAR_0100631 [Daucus carota subsp. sativus]|uniref:Uncharacterized protein n=1 Tax=Daucus carota subsp. sativus TaxID=79200 RepID=A0A166FTD1_DAUCS|nr:hypothetical protein DCAR_0100631 [Daucus carota subsp. sativus]